QVDGVDAEVARKDRGDVDERALRAAEAVDEDDVGSLAARQRADALAAGQRDVMDAQQRRAAVLECEEPFEGDRQVQSPADVQPPLPERLAAGDLAAPQRPP